MTAPNPSIPTNAAPTMRQILEPIYRIYHSMGRCPDFHSFASRYSPGSEAASLRRVRRLRALYHAPSDFRLNLVFLAHSTVFAVSRPRSHVAGRLHNVTARRIS